MIVDVKLVVVLVAIVVGQEVIMVLVVVGRIALLSMIMIVVILFVMGRCLGFGF